MKPPLHSLLIEGSPKIRHNKCNAARANVLVATGKETENDLRGGAERRLSEPWYSFASLRRGGETQSQEQR